MIHGKHSRIIIIFIIIARALGVSGLAALRAPASAANVENLFCDPSARVLFVASWWPAVMLVHYVTSHFMENRNLFVVGLVKFDFIACVCNLERPSRQL
jgi:hypothetical protein